MAGFSYDSEGIKKAVEGGEQFMAEQAAHVAAVAANEAARRASLPTATLPVGVYATKAEAEAYLREQEAQGRKSSPADPDDPSGALVKEISSPFNGYQTVWITNVNDPESGLNVHMEGHG